MKKGAYQTVSSAKVKMKIAGPSHLIVTGSQALIRGETWESGTHEFEVWSLKFEVWSLEFGVWSLEFGVWSSVDSWDTYLLFWPSEFEYYLFSLGGKKTHLMMCPFMFTWREINNLHCVILLDHCTVSYWNKCIVLLRCSPLPHLIQSTTNEFGPPEKHCSSMTSRGLFFSRVIR